MRIAAITIYKSQKATGVSLPFPRPKILKMSRVYNVQCTSKNYDCEKNGNDDRRNEPGGQRVAKSTMSLANWLRSRWPFGAAL
jgi:hypothetical protein